MLAILLLLIGVLVVYRWWISIYKHWDERGVGSVPGTFPFGSDYRMTVMSEYDGYVQQEMYEKFSSYPYYGIYMMRSPFLVIKDPEIISLVLTKEFSHFRDRQFIKIHESDFLSHHLFNLNGEKWRALRMRLSPTFTSGKIKAMFPLFVKCAETLESVLLDRLESASIDVKEIVACFTTDIICSCAFGIETNTISDPGNEFRKIGSSSLNVPLNVILKFLLHITIPEMSHLIPFKFIDGKVEKFLLRTISDTVKYREDNNLKRNDFLDLLIQLKQKGFIEEDTKENNGSHPVEMTLEVMAAQCFVFFVAGFETSSSVQSFCLYELALKPNLQKRLQDEIDETIQKYGSITYEAIKSMVFLHQVVSETMRKYPTFSATTRVCTNSLKLSEEFTILKGDQILIPVWSLHRDQEYFPNPTDFDPERFSEQNKGSIKPYTYLPFGEGPRMCIGMRFGLLQTKMGIITILRRYSLEPTKETKIPIELKGPAITTVAKDPIRLKLVLRK